MQKNIFLFIFFLNLKVYGASRYLLVQSYFFDSNSKIIDFQKYQIREEGEGRGGGVLDRIGGLGHSRYLSVFN